MRYLALLAAIACLASGCTDRCFVDGVNCENLDLPEEFSAIALGLDHTCGVHTDGRVECWGADHAKPSTGRFTMVAAGDFHSCAAAYRSVACWGNPALPQAQAPMTTLFDSVVAGAEFSCATSALKEAATCWGSNSRGQSSPPSAGMVSLAAGREHACGIGTSGAVMCWGRNDAGQAPPNAGRDYIALTAGDLHTCGLSAAGLVTCWGAVPDGVAAPAIAFRSISAGSFHTCGVRQDDQTLVCWGNNSDGQASPPSGRFIEVASGARHTCAITETGQVVCWGNNDHGQSDPP